jgi:hypothetical protein
MNPWWSGLPPAQSILPCGEHHHRLRWEAGALHALDHDDPEGERALAALGGERHPCLDVLDAWSRHADDPRVLVLASRGPADPLAAEAGWVAQLGTSQAAGARVIPSLPRTSTRALLRMPARRRAITAARARAGVTSVAAGAPPAGQLSLRTRAESELVALLGLGGGLQDRLAATVAAAWAGRLQRGDPASAGTRATLHASMHGRLAAAVRVWLGRNDLEFELELIEAPRPPTLTGRHGAVQAELPFGWLAEVWSRGLSTVWGRFCLAAATEDGITWTLTTVGPDLGPPAPIRIELPTAPRIT